MPRLNNLAEACPNRGEGSHLWEQGEGGLLCFACGEAYRSWWEARDTSGANVTVDAFVPPDVVVEDQERGM